MTPQSKTKLNIPLKYRREIEATFENTLAGQSEAQIGQLAKQIGCYKSRETVALRAQGKDRLIMLADAILVNVIKKKKYI